MLLCILSSFFLGENLIGLFPSRIKCPYFRMPATAGRVRMPANNRVHSSAALQTHGIWQSAIGYDPYAPNKDDDKNSSQQKASNSEPEAENAYASFQGLLALARITGSNADEARGACKRCGRVGHLSFQCRNFLSIKDDNKEKDPAAIEADILSELDKLKGSSNKGNGKRVEESSEESSEEEEDSRYSDYDSEIERIIAERSGKKVNRKTKSSKTKDSEDDDDDTDSAKRKKRGRSKKRRSRKREGDDSDSSDGGRRRRSTREKRRRRDESSDEEVERHQRHRKSRKEKRRRRSHRSSEDSEFDSSEDTDRHHKRKNRKHSDISGSDDSRVGRDRKRSEKKSRKRHHEDDE